MEITTKELKEKIENGEKIIVEFWGTWCGPCKVMKPIFEQVAKSTKENNLDVSLYTFNIDEDKEFVLSLGLRSIPTLKGFNNSKEVFSKTGILRKEEIIELINQI